MRTREEIVNARGRDPRKVPNMLAVLDAIFEVVLDIRELLQGKEKVKPVDNSSQKEVKKKVTTKKKKVSKA